MSKNSTASIGSRTEGYAVAKLLQRAQAVLVLERFGQVDPQGMNKSLTRKYRRLEALPPAIAPIAEGVAPAGQSLIKTDIQLTLEQYADAIPFTDVIEDTIEDNTLDDMTKLAAQQAAETKETIRFNALKAGTNVFFGGTGTTRGTVNGTLTRSLLRKVYRNLRSNRAAYFTEIVAATAKVGTEPVGQSYFAVCHPNLDADIKDITGFTPVEKYADSSKAMPNEIGKAENFRFITSDLFAPFLAAGASGSTYLTNGSTGTGAADVYPVLVFGKDAYAIVPMQGKNAVKIAVVNPTPSASDPCGQQGWVSWKMYDGCVILNDLWMARVEVGATQTPS
jgi:N4-gp56 family major capsid protein